MLRLSALALRRTLPPWLLAGFLVLLLLAARSAHGTPLVEVDERSLAGLRALARQNTWSVLFVLAPLLFLQAARLGTGAANAWLATTPAPRILPALSLAAGCALACLIATLLTALVSEATTGNTGTAWRRASVLENPSGLLDDSLPGLRWSVPAPAPGERLRLWTTVAIGSGPAVSARFTVRSGESATTVEQRVAGRTALELDPPRASDAHDGTLELELERIGTGALLALPPHALEVLVPCASERWTALALGGRVLVFLVSGCALALGLASRMRPGLAAAVVLALALFSWTDARAERLVPGADLPRAWSELGGGLVPSALPSTALAGAFALVALGLVLRASSPGGREGAR